jgi:hypothetical protein
MQHRQERAHLSGFFKLKRAARSSFKNPYLAMAAH